MNNLSSRGVILLVGLASIFVILFGIRGSAYIINPILLATVITITVLPVPGRLTQRGMPGWLGLVVTILLVVLVLGVVIATVFFSVTKLTTELPTYTASASQQASEDLSADSATSEEIEQVTVSVSGIAGDLLGGVINMLVQFGLALGIFFFMIAAALALPAPSRLGLDPNAPTIKRVALLTEDVRSYMAALTVVNLLVGLGDMIVLLIMGIPYALLWGLLAWFMGYIPSIGFWIAMIPPILLAYAQYGLQSAVIVLIAYVVINGGVSNIIQPKLMGDRLKISPVVVFIGLFVWGYLLGGLGAILAVPMTLLVLLVMDNFEGTRPLVTLMRFTGKTKEGEKQEAVGHVKGLWGKVKGAVSPDREPEEIVPEPKEIVPEPEDNVRESKDNAE